MAAPMLAVASDVAAATSEVTSALLAAGALVLACFALRPELWRHLVLDRIDPRPAALLRIALGLVVLWAFVDLLPVSRLLFSDEGLWLTGLARRNYGGSLARLWDPEHGFEGWGAALRALWSRGSILHLRSDPPVVALVHGAALVSLGLMIVGVWTRVTTVSSWVLVEQLYRVSPIFYNGGDLVVRIFLFLGMFCAWGRAYSWDTWRARRRAILGGAGEIPPLARIPAWPQRLMMLQLVIIYTATGLLKSGETWWDGTAMYYALNLDHFYRVPMTSLVAWAQRLGVLPVMTWAVHLWELLFPLAAVGAALRGYERARREGRWPEPGRLRRLLSWGLWAGAWVLVAHVAGVAARVYLPPGLRPPGVGPWVTGGLLVLAVLAVGGYRLLRARAPHAHRLLLDVVLGKRLWLGAGLIMHAGIDLTLNVGTFAPVMVAVYLAWLGGDEIDHLWRWVGTRPCRPGEEPRPTRGGWGRLVWAPLDRARWRVPRRTLVMGYAPDARAVRRAALVRPWDLAGRLTFARDPSLPAGQVALVGVAAPEDAGLALARALPGLWPLLPLLKLPVVGRSPARWLWRRFARAA